MGDTADHIPGLPEYRGADAKGNLKYKAIGEKTAQTFIDACADAKEAAHQVCDLYFLSYHRNAANFMDRQETDIEWADRLAEQAALLWMRCGMDAPVDDFLIHNGHSRIPWPSAMTSAAARLKERVSLARNTINSLGHSDDPLCSVDCPTE